MAEETKKFTDEELQQIEEGINRRIDEEIAARTFRGIKEHYRELLFCIETEDIKRWNMWRKRQNKNNVELEGAQLTMVDLKNANLNSLRIQESNLEGADLSGAKLEDARLLNSYLFMVKFQNANLRGAKLFGADCRCVDFRDADLSHAKTDGADLTEIKIDKNTKFKETIFGNAVLSINNKCETANITIKLTEKEQIEILSKGIVNGVQFVDPVFGRKVRDEAWLNHFKKRCKDSNWKKIGLWFWEKTCDYGRNFWKWGIWSLGIAFVFGIIYILFGPEYFKPKPEGYTCFSFFYYSFVTFTTLGFGDITPITWCTEILVTIEVALGYIMLGGLISILANKLARRYD